MFWWITGKYSLILFMFPFLTLDESTLFYWLLLSDASQAHTKQKHLSAIDKWASAIPSTKPSSQAPKSTSSHVKTEVPSLTSGSSGRSYAPSVLSDNVKIVSHHSNTVKVKSECAPALSLYNNGGLSDNDELIVVCRIARYNIRYVQQLMVVITKVMLRAVPIPCICF